MIKVDFKLFCLFLEKGRGVAATPGLLWIALKIEKCFSIMKISKTPTSDGWGSLKRFLSRPNIFDGRTLNRTFKVPNDCTNKMSREYHF